MSFHTIVLFLTLSAWAVGVAFTRADFKSADTVDLNGKIYVRAMLSAEGLKKMKDLNRNHVGENIEMDLGHERYFRRLKTPIVSQEMEMGPFNQTEAHQIISEINLGK
jgi:hypothetical protein